MAGLHRAALVAGTVIARMQYLAELHRVLAGIAVEAEAAHALAESG